MKFNLIFSILFISSLFNLANGSILGDLGSGLSSAGEAIKAEEVSTFKRCVNKCNNIGCIENCIKQSKF